MTITLRTTKGSELTFAELDGNFTDLDGRILDSSAIQALIDSAYIQARQVDSQRDSAFITSIIDSSYVQSKVFIADSAEFLTKLGAVKGNIVPATDSAFDLGDSNYRWKDLWLSGNTLHLGDARIAWDGNSLDFNRTINAEIEMSGDLDMKANVITSTTDKLQIVQNSSGGFAGERIEFLRAHGDAGFLPSLTIDGNSTGSGDGQVIIGDSPGATYLFGDATYLTLGRKAGMPDSSVAFGGSMIYNTATGTYSLKDSNGWFSLSRNAALTDSAAVIGVVDSAYVNTRVDYDSATTVAIVDSDYVKDRQIPSGAHYIFGLADSAVDVRGLGGTGVKLKSAGGVTKIITPCQMTLTEMAISFDLDSVGQDGTYSNVSFEILRNGVYDGTLGQLAVGPPDVGTTVTTVDQVFQQYDSNTSLEIAMRHGAGGSGTDYETKNHTVTLRMKEGHHSLALVRSEFNYDNPET